MRKDIQNKQQPQIVKVNLNELSPDARRAVEDELARYERAQEERARQRKAIKAAAKIRNSGTPTHSPWVSLDRQHPDPKKGDVIEGEKVATRMQPDGKTVSVVAGDPQTITLDDGTEVPYPKRRTNYMWSDVKTVAVDENGEEVQRP